MRLLVLTPWWPATAGDPHGSFIRDQALALQAAGHDVRVGVLRLVRPPAPSSWLRSRRAGSSLPGAGSGLAGGLPVTRASGPWLPYRRGYDVLVRQWTAMLTRLVLRQGAWTRRCVILVHTQDLAVPAHRLQARTGLPYVLVAHGEEPDSPRYEGRSRRRAYVAALSAAASVVAVGPGLARHLRAECPGAAVRVVLNGYDRSLVERVLRERPADRAEPRLVSVSILSEGKGVHLTLEALAARARRGLHVPVYDVVGDGPHRRALEGAVARHGLGDRVRFHGRLSYPAALQVVHGATAFVLPSAPEALGIAYLEAMALGVPPVAVATEGPAAFIEDGATGLLVARTTEGVGGAIDRLLEDPTGAARLGAAASLRALDLDWSPVAAALAPLLRRALAPRPPTSAPLWLSLYNEPTPYVTAKQALMEASGRVRLQRAWASVNASQLWGDDAPFDAKSVLEGSGRTLDLLVALLRRQFAGVHAGGWGGPRVTPLLLLGAWIAGRPLVLESDTHVSGSSGSRALLRRAYLRLLDRRVRCWLPGGTPQSAHLLRTVTPRSPVRIEGMTTDTGTLLAEASRRGPSAGGDWRTHRRISPSSALVLYVGRLATEKGVADLVAAVARLRSEGRDVHLALVGPGALDPTVASTLPSERLRTLGRVPWRELVPAYLAADVLALPSRTEPWGLVVNEALLLGCPVVVTDAVGAAEDLVRGPGAGIVVPAANVAALAEGLLTVLDAGGRASPFATRGRAIAARWSTEAAASSVLAAMGVRAAPRC